LFLELIPRLVVELAPLEALDRLDKNVSIAGEAKLAHGGQGIHHRNHVRRRQLRLDELDQRLAHGHVIPATHVIVIEEDHEQPDVGS
jgi:hypothetical protein